MAKYDSKAVPPRVQNLIGKAYGRWTVVSYSHAIPRKDGVHYRHYWLCECDCGTVRPVISDSLKSGKSQSCGCYHQEVRVEVGKRGAKHGMRDEPEYYVWRSMKSRCYNPKQFGYEYYGGRGITVCERWLDSFEEFYKDMGPRPSDAHSIDRIDNDGNYTPENCRWATVKQQERNKSSNHYITFRGETRTLQGWAEHLGINHKSLRNRINTLGWSYERALTEPIESRD